MTQSEPDPSSSRRNKQIPDRRGLFANSEARVCLVLLLFALVLLYAVLATLFARYAVELVQHRGLDMDLADVYLFAFFYVLLAYFLTALPLLMVVGYHGIEWKHLQTKVERELTLLGLEVGELRSRMTEYAGRNGLHAFLLPMLVNLILLFLMWHSALFPNGMAGIFDGLDLSGEVRISIAILLPMVVVNATVVTWAFFGAYFYGITAMIRRWMRQDLTVGSVWRTNVRLAVAFILGMLIMDTFTTIDGSLSIPPPGLTALAFMVGIVPDTFLRWISLQAKRLLGGATPETTGVFEPNDLQGKLGGVSFWQLDRLAEEGIESVQDLAMKDLPTLLIHTRFDTPLLLYWVDRSLLCVHTGERLDLFRRAGIGRATELLLQQEQGRLDAVMRSLTDAHESFSVPPGHAVTVQGFGSPPPITREVLDNILVGLQHGPNLLYLRHYWRTIGVTLSAPPDSDSSLSPGSP